MYLSKYTLKTIGSMNNISVLYVVYFLNINARVNNLHLLKIINISNRCKVLNCIVCAAKTSKYRDGKIIYDITFICIHSLFASKFSDIYNRNFFTKFPIFILYDVEKCIFLHNVEKPNQILFSLVYN